MPRRSAASDVFVLVNRGYDEATRTAEQWLALHADDWRMNCTVGSLLADWSEFAYFQSVATDDSGDRFASYLKHSQQALSRFRRSRRLRALVPKLKRNEFDLLPYRAWFYGLLGITHDGGVNLRKGVTRDEIDKIRKALLDLPGGASARTSNCSRRWSPTTSPPIASRPEMKYRYLSSARPHHRSPADDLPGRRENQILRLASERNSFANAAGRQRPHSQRLSLS